MSDFSKLVFENPLHVRVCVIHRADSGVAVRASRRTFRTTVDRFFMFSSMLLLVDPSESQIVWCPLSFRI